MRSILTYDVSTSDKGAECEFFSRVLYSHMEEYALSIISEMKSLYMSLFPASGGTITGWMYHPKGKQLEMTSHPKFATGEPYEEEDKQGNAHVPTWIVEINTQRCVLHAQLQQQLYSTTPRNRNRTNRNHLEICLSSSQKK